jgi:iron complex outermembrane receptor protein
LFAFAVADAAERGSSLRTHLLLATATLLSSTSALAAEAGAPNDDLVVTGQRASTSASSGTKTDTPLLETPQSVSVIDASDIARLGLQNLNQALRFVAGVTPEQRGASAEVYDQFKLRGFDAPVYLDGLKLFSSASGYAVPQVDVSRLDRIEIIKGPASVLYGQSTPGGLVAESSKLPIASDFYGAVSGSYGTYNLYRVDADVGGRLSDTTLWRLYGSVNGADAQQHYGVRRRQTVSGAVTLGAGTPTDLTVLAAYSRDPKNGNYGVFPAVGTFFDNPNGRISTKFYGGEPNDFFKREQAAATYIFNHDFGGGWRFHASGRYQYVSSRLGIVYISGFPVDVTQAAPTLYNRSSYSTDEENNAWTYDNQLSGSFTTGPLSHKVLIGLDRQVSHSDEDYAFGGATPIDAYNPVFGTMLTPRTPAQVPAGPFGLFGGATKTQLRQQGIYAQDQIAAGGLRLTLSGRQDWARAAQGGPDQHDDKFTYRVAGLYLLPFGLAPYASYSTSFEPIAGSVLRADGTLGTARPSIGKQFEVGAKYQVPDTEILVTASWFRIIQSNLLIGGPIPGSSVQGGKFRSRGVELEASAPLPYGFNAKLAFSHQRVRNLNPEQAFALLGVGRGGISANLEWAPKEGTGAGFAIGGAVRHVNAIEAGSYYDGVAYLGNVDYRTPSYTLFDALMRYDLGRLSGSLDGISLAVNAQNVFDKKYLSTCYLTYGWCWYGNRRTIQGTVTYKW